MNHAGFPWLERGYREQGSWEGEGSCSGKTIDKAVQLFYATFHVYATFIMLLIILQVLFLCYFQANAWLTWLEEVEEEDDSDSDSEKIDQK